MPWPPSIEPGASKMPQDTFSGGEGRGQLSRPSSSSQDHFSLRPSSVPPPPPPKPMTTTPLWKAPPAVKANISSSLGSSSATTPRLPSVPTLPSQQLGKRPRVPSSPPPVNVEQGSNSHPTTSPTRQHLHQHPASKRVATTSVKQQQHELAASTSTSTSKKTDSKYSSSASSASRIKAKTKAKATPSKPRIEIHLPVLPRPYRPGDGPPTAPLRLLPRQDTDAYVVAKHVLPGEPKVIVTEEKDENDSTSAAGGPGRSVVVGSGDGGGGGGVGDKKKTAKAIMTSTMNPNKKKKRKLVTTEQTRLQMFYVVAWPDLPAARVLVNAKRVLEYVSPRALEQFEYEQLLAREEEERLAEERENVAAVEAAIRAEAEAGAEGTASGLLRGDGGQDKKKKGKRKGRPPSKAKRLAEQVAQETSRAVSKAAEDMGMAAAAAAAGGVGPSLSTTPQKKMGMVMIPKDLPEEDEDDINEAEKADTEEEVVMAEGLEEEDEMNPEAAIFEQLCSNAAAAANIDFGDEDDIPATIKAPTAGRASQNDSPRLHKKPAPKEEDVAIATPIASKPRDTTHQKPPASAAQSRGPSTLFSYGFTPAGRSSGKWPSANPPESHTTATETKSAVADSSRSPTKSSQKRTKKKQGDPSQASPTIVVGGDDEARDEDPDELVWEVKRLEGDRIEKTRARRSVRMFKVRWEGNWPADQNPTWEPEHNIDRKLVQKYLKRKAAGKLDYLDSPGGGSGRSKSPLMQAMRRKYSSVAEAFADEGDAAVDDEPRQSSFTPTQTKKTTTTSRSSQKRNGSLYAGPIIGNSDEEEDGDEDIDNDGEEEERLLVIPSKAEDERRRRERERLDNLIAMRGRRSSSTTSSTQHPHNPQQQGRSPHPPAVKAAAFASFGQENHGGDSKNSGNHSSLSHDKGNDGGGGGTGVDSGSLSFSSGLRFFGRGGLGNGSS